MRRMNRRMGRFCGVILLVASVLTTPVHASLLSPSVRLISGPVNGVAIERKGRALVVYGDPAGTIQRADMVLFTHGRRDVIWAGRDLIERGAKAVIPKAEASTFSDATAFWENFATARFHDYQQQTTKWPARALRVDRAVADGETITWQDLSLKVIATPGYTRGAVSYLADIDKTRYAFVGDLIYGDGQLFDLYSLQDAVTEAKIGGYHGYAGRIGPLIQSLRRLLAQQPDILVPARGPVIRNPEAAVGKLIERLQTAYANYLSVNAGRWYFRERYDTLAERALGTTDVPWMEWATIDETPPGWMIPISNSRLLLSKSGDGWLIDCGAQSIIDKVKTLRDAGRLKSLEGLFITHYHDDHTNTIKELRAAFPCPVYVTPLMADILKQPHRYRLPAMTSHAVDDPTIVGDRYTRRWHEFRFTFYDFPGQTLYHSALLVENDNGEKLFFQGDSFTPSGIDDYCLLNRNLMHPDRGYLYCLDVLETLPATVLLVNEHVGPAFRFDSAQLALMRRVLAERKQLLEDLFPWADANYGIDERWARIDPYGQGIRPGQTVEIAVRILNHSDRAHTYIVTPHGPDGFNIKPTQARVAVKSREEAAAVFRITAPSASTSSVAVVTADIAFDQWDLRHWCEAILEPIP